MNSQALLTIILGAGKGTRMKSKLPKVMHAVAGRSMLAHVIALAEDAGSTSMVGVVGPDMDDVADVARTANPSIKIAIQKEQRGTGDAVLAARQELESHSGDVLVLYADTPLITSATLQRLRDALSDDVQVSVLGFEAEDPTGYGRLLTNSDGGLEAIREHKDCSEAERSVRLCNSGVMAFRVRDLAKLLDGLTTNNANGEYYLTDAVALVRAAGGQAAAVQCDETEVLGVNSRGQLAVAEAIWQARKRAAVMADGVTLIAPNTVWFSFDTDVGRDVIIEPNVVFGPGVKVDEDVTIKASSHIEGAHIGRGARIGPFARLRPGADLGPETHIGNFVEVKNTKIGTGAKANHLSYLGDGDIGPKANIGAGTIFCNYDGFNKAKTEVGAGAFVGSNSSLVAPVKIGDGAFIGSGSVITRNVSPDALALERSEQDERAGWAEKFRILMQKTKRAKAGKAKS
ncbi:MAG: bifunctional UDP-N-acetylglucosamine diphosphorylase/glucosamine-1-phosphate N-acetyltransferase GlmU [Hyphomicrobiaceae bacterium]